MENTQAHPLIKKTRRLPRVWKRFFALKAGEQFHSPTGALRTKAGPFWSHSLALGILYFVPPWRRVRTTVYVRDVLSGGKSSADLLPTPGTGKTYQVDPAFVGPDYAGGPATQPTDDNRTGPSA